MRKTSWIAVVLAALALAGGDARGEDAAPGKAVLAVLPFQAQGDIPYRHPTEMASINDAFVRTFVKTGKFDVVERERIESVLKEHDFAGSGYGDPANAAQIGQLLGAQYLVVGTIHELGVDVSRSVIPYVDEVRCTARARIRLEMRVVRTSTGKIVSAQTADSNDIGAKGQACGASANDALAAACERVATFLVGRTIDLVYPIKVVLVSGDEITLNRGEGGDFVVGATLDCFTQGEEIVDPDTHETLGAAETPVGAITVHEIRPKFSRAHSDTGAPIPAQAVCRVVRRAPAPKPSPPRVRPRVNF